MNTKTLFERQERGLNLKHVTTTIPADIYNRLVDFAWNSHLTRTKAITDLLAIGLDIVENKKEG